MGQTIKGIFLKSVINLIEKKVGPEGVEKIRQAVGTDLNFSAIKNYPAEYEMKIYDEAIKLLFGEVTPQNYRRYAHYSFQFYFDSVIGKTIFSLLGSDAKKAALNIPQIIATITSGFHLKSQDLGLNKVLVTMSESVYPIEYYQGIWEAALDHFQRKGTVTPTDKGNGNHEYLIEWQ